MISVFENFNISITCLNYKSLYHFYSPLLLFFSSLLFSPKPFLLFLLLLLLCFPPLVLSMSEGPQLDALGDVGLVDPPQPQVGVDDVEEVELELGDEGVL